MTCFRLLAVLACTIGCSPRPGAEGPPPDSRADAPERAEAPPTAVPDRSGPLEPDAEPAVALPDAAGASETAAAQEPEAVEVAAPCSHVPGFCRVAVLPLGDPPEREIEAVVERLRDFYGVDVRLMDGIDLPQEAWYAPRSRWRADVLLDFLAPRLPEGCDHIVGLTSKDISTTKGDIEDWGILGLGSMPGVACVFSSFRCRGRIRDVPAIERLARVAIHEVGHTLGLPHCPTYGCFMEDAGGRRETIDRETFLCDICRERLGWID